MSDENIHTEFPTYNGMNRPAMFFGVPMMPMVFCILGSVFVRYVRAVACRQGGIAAGRFEHPGLLRPQNRQRE